MSFDVFVQGFRAGEASDHGWAAMRAVLEPHVVERDGDVVRLRLDDGEADISWHAAGLMASHVSGELAWDLLVDGARAADWVILPVGCPTCLTSPDQRRELPDGLDDDVVVVETGAQLRAIIASA